MMRGLYSFGISCYALGVRVASLFNPKAKQMVQGWKRTPCQITGASVGEGKTAWFHASSLGEFEQARPVIERFHEQHPDYKLCVTFFSPSGYEIRKDYPLADVVCYLPMDTRANAARFVAMLRPSVAFFVKYDFWFNYLDQLCRRGVPTYIFSAIFRPGQYFFKWYGGWFLGHLQRCYSHLFVQNEESLQLLKSHGVPQVSIAGDTRFDRVRAIAQNVVANAVVEHFLACRPDTKVLLAGSSWEPDEAHLKRFFDKQEQRVSLILAPHVISDSHIAYIEKLFRPERCVRYSQLAAGGRAEGRGVLIIDNIGMRSSLYRYAHIAYIGGGFGRGIHNTLEAITFGKPVVFGPNYHKFKEACDIIGLGGGFSYSNYEELESVLSRLMGDEAYYQHASAVCVEYLEANLGSAEQIVSLVNNNIQH